MTTPSPRLDGPTPGPWEIRTLENFGWNVVHYIDGDRFDLLRIAKVGEEANARLITAAPDLAEAAVLALELIESGRIYEQQCCSGQDCGCRGSTYADEATHFLRAALARAAITRARGKDHA